MKRMSIISMMLIISIFLTSCSYQAYERPDLNGNEIWICEKPYLEMYWTENNYGGKLIVKETTYNIVHFADHGAHIWIYEDDENLDLRYEESEKYCLFRGIANYGKEKMTITVDIDYKNIFGGEKPTFELVKHKK